MKNTVYIFGLLILVASCAIAPPINDLNYEKNTFTQINNQKVVEDSFDNVWDRLVSGLSRTFYVINNIDKESRLINVSFNMNDQLSNYVDCGTSKREFQLVDFADSVIYEVANSSSYFTTSTAPPNPNVSYHKVFRNTSLEGRANVYIAPSEKGTTIMVNTRYVFNVKVTFEGDNPELHFFLYKVENT